MTNTVEMLTGLKKEYNEELYRMIDQELSYLKPIVDIKQVTKEGLYLDDIGQTSFQEDNSAMVTIDSKAKDIKYGRRELNTSNFYAAHKMDRSVSDLLAPSSSSYTDKVLKEIMTAYVYNCDKVLYSAFDADAKDKNGNAISFATDGGITGADLKAVANFTAKNFVVEKQKLQSKGFGLYNNSPLYFIGTDVERGLLENDTNASNSDYAGGFGVIRDTNTADLKKLKGVELVTFASVGTTEHPTILYKTGTTVGTHYRKCFMFSAKAVTLGITKDLITEIVDLNQTYFSVSAIKAHCKIGATRNANAGIISIKTPVAMA